MKIGSKAHKKRRKSKIAWRMQAVISTISVSLLLILMGLVVLLSLTARVVADSVKENLTVTLVLNDDVQTQQAVHLLDSLNKMHYVSGIDYISREQALQEQIENMGLDPTEFLGTNPFAISMEMRVKPEFSSADSLQWISQELRRSDLVADVMYQKDLVESLNRNLHRASYFLLAVALLLVIISLSLINNTVRLSVFSHRFVIHTMKLVGAKWSFIRRPFLANGFTLGIISAIIADALLYAGYVWAQKYEQDLNLVVNDEVLIIVGASVLVFGLLITFLCTYISVQKYLKMSTNKLYYV